MLHKNLADPLEFNLFGLQEGLVALYDPGAFCSIPPADTREYHYRPVPLDPPPPMPSEVFIHFLEHEHAGVMSAKKYWTPKIPKRLKQRLIDCPVPIDGWGIHIIEGPNKMAIWWITLFTMFSSILASTLWSSLRADIQGGTGLGSLILAMPSVFLSAFLYAFVADKIV